MLHSLQSTVDSVQFCADFCDCGYYNTSDFESDCGFEFSYNNRSHCYLAMSTVLKD